MGNTIPYFYADLIARMVPGAVLISLIRITTLPMPKPWVDFITNLGSAQAVIIPILLAGLAYILGTVLEALLNSILEKIYIHAFDSALSKKYSCIYQVSNDIQIKNIRSPKDLSRASFGHLISSPSDREKQSIPHIVRFHSEAKMGFSTVIILCAFLILAVVNKYTTYQLISNEIEQASVWLLIIVFIIVALVATTYQRLLTRALFVMRTIERSAAEKDASEAIKELRDELLAFCDSKKMKIRYYIDPETKQPHIYNHGVSEDDVEDVLRKPGEDRSGREGSRVSIGQTKNGRYLRVIYVPDPVPYSIFVITAYDLSEKLLKAYRRRRRRKLK